MSRVKKVASCVTPVGCSYTDSLQGTSLRWSSAYQQSFDILASTYYLRVLGISYRSFPLTIHSLPTSNAYKSNILFRSRCGEDNSLIISACRDSIPVEDDLTGAVTHVTPSTRWSLLWREHCKSTSFSSFKQPSAQEIKIGLQGA